MVSTLLLALMPLSLWGGVLPEAIVRGRITNFDKKDVQLFKDGQTTTVPRDSIPKHFKIKPGKYVYAVLKSTDLTERIAKAKKEREAKKKKKTKKKKK